MAAFTVGLGGCIWRDGRPHGRTWNSYDYGDSGGHDRGHDKNRGRNHDHDDDDDDDDD